MIGTVAFLSALHLSLMMRSGASASDWADDTYECLGSDGLPLGTFVNSSQLCDGTPDCERGEDERTFCDCPPENTFVCLSGIPDEGGLYNGVPCIPADWVCDSYIDCVDGEDETDCELPGSGDDTYECLGPDGLPLGTFINSSQLCDGTPDCVRGEDERTFCDCPPENTFVCLSGIPDEGGLYNGVPCIPADWVCDSEHYIHCVDGEDEAECATTGVTTTLPSTTTDGDERLSVAALSAIVPPLLLRSIC